jgi:hypothetical protein
METGTYLLQHTITDKKGWNNEVVITHDVESGFEQKSVSIFA